MNRDDLPTMKNNQSTVAVLIPCYNEEATIYRVISDFKAALPDAKIYVFDNNSSDKTIEEAKRAQAIVVSEYRQGKGNVVRSMFRLVEADFYVMVDGDLTYPASDVHSLLEPVVSGRASMVVGDRHSSKAYEIENTRRFHGAGNRLVRWLINKLFRVELKDIMSGYRVFSRFFVKTCPVMSDGFEIETELTLHALDKKFSLVEVPIGYKDRPEGSVSKLNTFLDGYRILKTILWLFKDYKPFLFFGFCSFVFFVLGWSIGVFPVLEYIQTSYVKKVPSAVLAASLEVLAMLCLVCGVILDTIVRQNKEAYELKLLNYKVLSGER